METLRKALWDTALLFYQRPRFLFLGLFGVAITAFFVWLLRPKEVFIEHLRARVGIPFLALVATFLLGFIYMLLRSPYDQLAEISSQLSKSLERERESFIGRQTAERLLASEKDENKRLTNESAHSPVLVRTGESGQRANASPAQQQCWVSNHFGLPNSTIKGAVTATAAILRCNYEIEAPFRVAVEFDRDFIPGGMVLPDLGTMMGSGERKQGRIFVGQVESPALPSNYLVVVTVYGETGQYPRVLRADIKSLK